MKLEIRSMENTSGKELRKIKVTNGDWLKLLKGSMLTIKVQKKDGLFKTVNLKIIKTKHQLLNLRENYAMNMPDLKTNQNQMTPLRVKKI